MKSILLIPILILSTITALHADHNAMYAVSGMVLDSTDGTPLSGATVYIQELKRGTLSHKDGTFSMNEIPEGSYTLTVRFIGYAEEHVRVIVTNSSLHITIRLKQTAIASKEVVVTGTSSKDDLNGSNQSVTIISARDLDQHRGQTLGESLKDVPGVTLLQTGPSIAKPVIRGLHSQRVVVVNGGVAQEGQQWGAEHAPEIDPFAPSRIEVLRGPAGVEYGAGAIGGVIRLEPRPLPDSAGINGELSIIGFSNNGQASGSLLLESGFGEGFGVRVQLSGRKAGDSRTPDYVIGNTGFEELDASGTAGYHSKVFGSELTVSHFGTQLGIYKGSHIHTLDDLMRAIASGQPLASYTFGYKIDNPRQEITHDVLSLNVFYNPPDAGRFRLNYSYQENNRVEYDAHNLRYTDSTQAPPPTKPGINLSLQTWTAGLSYHHQPGEGFYGSLGVSGMRQWNTRSGTTLLIPDYLSYSGGAYALENYLYGEWNLSAGIRYDYRWTHVYPMRAKNIEDRVHEYANLSAALGGIWQFATEWSLACNVGTAWRPPGINELYSNDVHHGTAQYEVGDPNLKNERSISVDATLRHQNESLRFELSAYNNSIANFIYLLPLPDPVTTIRGAFPAFAYKQANAVLRGIDGSIDWQILDEIRVGGTISLVRGDNLTTNEPLIFMPSDRARIYTHCHLPELIGLTEPYIELSGTLVRHQDRYPRNIDYSDPPPGYALMDIQCGAMLTFMGQSVSASLSVNNIFDTAYRDYLSRFRYFTDDPGRNIILRISILFGKHSEQ